MDRMDELRSPSLSTSPAASIIVFPSPSTLSSSSFSGQYGVQRNRGQLMKRRCLRLFCLEPTRLTFDCLPDCFVLSWLEVRTGAALWIVYPQPNGFVLVDPPYLLGLALSDNSQVMVHGAH